MATYRVTYREENAEVAIATVLNGSRVLPQNVTLKSPGRIELRSSDGDVFRLQKDTEFCLIDQEEGMQPEIHGEVFSYVIATWWHSKHTSWTCRNHASAPLQLLVRPSLEFENTEEYILALGEMVIHDYDIHGRYFVICNLQQGEKAFVTYDPNLPVCPSRYTANIVDMSDQDWQYISENYLDNRKWM